MYRILKANSTLELESLVNKYLQSGYTLVGGVSAIAVKYAKYNNSIVYMQAVCPEEK